MKNNKFHKTPHKFITGLGQKPPNNKKYKLMVFVSYRDQKQILVVYIVIKNKYV